MRGELGDRDGPPALPAALLQVRPLASLRPAPEAERGCSEGDSEPLSSDSSPARGRPERNRAGGWAERGETRGRGGWRDLGGAGAAGGAWGGRHGAGLGCLPVGVGSVPWARSERAPGHPGPVQAGAPGPQRDPPEKPRQPPRQVHREGREGGSGPTPGDSPPGGPASGWVTVKS